MKYLSIISLFFMSISVQANEEYTSGMCIAAAEQARSMFMYETYMVIGVAEQREKDASMSDGLIMYKIGKEVGLSQHILIQVAENNNADIKNIATTITEGCVSQLKRNKHYQSLN